MSLEDIFGNDTPMSSLLNAIENLRLTDESLIALVPELTTLKIKLPPEIHADDEPFLDLSQGKLVGLCAEAQELLIARLLQHGETR